MRVAGGYVGTRETWPGGSRHARRHGGRRGRRHLSGGRIVTTPSRRAVRRTVAQPVRAGTGKQRGWRGQMARLSTPGAGGAERASGRASAQHRPQHSGRAGGPPASARASSARAQHPAACARRAHAQRHCARARRARAQPAARARGRAPNSSPGLICGDQQQF